MKMLNFPAFLLYLFMMSCAHHTTTSSTSSTGKYSEDLSVVRPKLELPNSDTVVSQTTNDSKQTTYMEPKFAINQQLDPILDSISSINKTQKYYDGFTIQVYSGSRREEALNIKKQLATSLPEIDSEIQYMQPNFRVKAGKYLQRLDAQKDYLTVKHYFPNAIVIPDKVRID